MKELNHTPLSGHQGHRSDMILNSKKKLKAVLIDVFDEHLSLGYVSNYMALDIGNWTYGLIQSEKNGNYENMVIPIKSKLADVEEYEDLVSPAFYNAIDTIFTSRRDSFDNQTLEYNMVLEIKIRLTE